MYRKVLDDNGKVRNDVIFRATDNAWIPTVAGNRDYDEFCKHCEKEKIALDDLQVKE